MEVQGEMGFFGDQIFEETNIMGREDSGSDQLDTVSIGEHPEESSQSTKKKVARRKRYHRHTPQQIQDLENFFKNCAHPDEKQRLELGKRLGLESRQIKFWFQNRRTQLKSQMERHENVILKQEYDKLRAENMALKDAIRSPMCQSCGGPAAPGELSMADQQLKLENLRLKDELIKVCAVTEKLVGKPVSEFFFQNRGANSSLELSMGRASGSLNGGLIGTQLPFQTMGFNHENGISSNSSITTALDGGMTSEYDKAVFIQASIAAMDDLLSIAQPDSTLWFKGLDGGKEMLIYEEYVKKCPPFLGMKPSGFITDATRETISVMIDSVELVDTMMSPNRWQELFPGMIGKAATLEVLIPGANGTRDGELQLMNAEFVFPSPFVPLRQEKILRFAKQHSEGMWSVVDVSVDSVRGVLPVKCRRLPSGCIVQDVGNGYSLVTWIEHVEYDENAIHQLYRPLLRSGLAFGAQRWLATLHRERECGAIFMSSIISPEEPVTPTGRRSILKLAKRISNNFCSSLCASSVHHWEKLHINGFMADVNIMSRASINEPGEPSGLVMSASTAFWLPVPRQDLYAFLKDEKLRGKWDVLANGGPMEVITSLPKSQDGVSSVTLLCPPAAPPREKNMLIVQESWSDETNSMIVYAPVDSASMDTVLRGGDSDYIAVLPSGFAIADGPIHPTVPTLANNGVGVGSAVAGASVLTLGFQILVSSQPTSKLTVESINTVNNLLACTIQKIRDSVGAN